MGRQLVSGFAIDPRSLAAFRIGLGVLVLADLALRALYLGDHYSDEGLLPREALTSGFTNPWYVSLHILSGKTAIQAALFLVAALAASALLVGYRTRVASIVVWVLTLSVQNRNPMLLQGGDDVLRLLTFWAMFVPLESCWSVDRLRGTARAVGVTRHLTIGTAALLLQVCVIYWNTYVLKNNPVWRTEHSALYYALHVDQFATPLGVALRQVTWLLPLLSAGVILWELWGPILALMPPRLAVVRTLAVLGFIAMHGGIAATMELGPFPYICMVAWIPFLPPWAWDRLRIRLPEAVPAGVEGRAVRTSRLAPVVAGLCLVYVLAWNVRSTNFPRWASLFPPSLNPVGEVLRLDQYWNMFAPAPMVDDGWFVVPGRFEDGTVADLFSEQPAISFEKPALVSATFPSERWRKYLMNLQDQANTRHRVLYGRWLCRHWNGDRPNGKRLAGFDVVYMRETTLATGIKPPERVTLWRHRCFEETFEGFDLASASL